jgi:hypothetical protein
VESCDAQSSIQRFAAVSSCGLLDDPLARRRNYLSLLLIIAIVVLMVTRPGS